MVEVELVTVRVEMPANTSVVLLRERRAARRLLPILIGNSEATAIAYALDGVETPRPMTHDLLKNLLDELGVTVEQVVVTELRDRTFYAELDLQLGRRHQLDVEPPLRRHRPGRPHRHARSTSARRCWPRPAYPEDDDGERRGVRRDGRAVPPVHRERQPRRLRLPDRPGAARPAAERSRTLPGRDDTPVIPGVSCGTRETAS